MLLGTAIGDALGNTSEGLLPARRRENIGWITNYLPNRYASNELAGVPSDDTQMTFWLVEHLLEHGCLSPEQLASTFASRQIFGMGSSVGAFRRNLNSGTVWQMAGARSAGNGALMRIAPILGPHLDRPTTKLWEDAAVCSAITHNDPASIACCIGYVFLLAELLLVDEVPELDWWADTFERVAPPVEGQTNHRPRGGVYLGEYDGSLTAYTVREVRKGLADGLDTIAFGKRVYSGAYLMETMPNVLFILAKFGSDPEQAVLEAVNGTKDNDTIAAIVGAAMGAMHGSEAFPRDWIGQLTGRLGLADDGKAFELTDAAVEAWLG
jgi:ADP-ribosylglycohydrolase